MRAHVTSGRVGRRGRPERAAHRLTVQRHPLVGSSGQYGALNVPTRGPGQPALAESSSTGALVAMVASSAAGAGSRRLAFQFSWSTPSRQTASTSTRSTALVRRPRRTDEAPRRSPSRRWRASRPVPAADRGAGAGLLRAVPARGQGVAYFRRFISAMAPSSRVLRTGAGGVSVVV